MKNKKTTIKKAQYVVESHCTNGNVFLHGPFRSKDAAREYVLDCEMEWAFGPNLAMATHKIRAMLNPNGWTK